MKKATNNLLYLAILILLISGCTSMEAVQKYSSSTKSTIESVRPVAMDFCTSCTRANSYKPLANRSKCESEQKASKAILLVANVLDEYAISLGALAADDLVSYDKDIGAMTKEIKGLKVKELEDEKVDAVGSLAKFIAKAATSAYQQKQVAQFIKDSDQSVVNVSQVLADAIEKNYSHAIELEITAWEDAYNRVERVDRSQRPLDFEVYSKSQWQSRADLEAKLKAATELSKGIREIGSTHTKLARDAEKLSGKEAAAFVKSFINDVTPVIKDVQDAFSSK